MMSILANQMNSNQRYSSTVCIAYLDYLQAKNQKYNMSKDIIFPVVLINHCCVRFHLVKHKDELSLSRTHKCV